MKGYIKIEATTHEGRDGLHIETRLENASYMDRMQVLHSVCRALKLDADELDLMAHMMRDGIIDAVVDTQVLRDDTEKADEDKCTCNKHKEKSTPDVNVDGLVALLKMLLS